jgi:hypothetical protein
MRMWKLGSHTETAIHRVEAREAQRAEVRDGGERIVVGRTLAVRLALALHPAAFAKATAPKALRAPAAAARTVLTCGAVAAIITTKAMGTICFISAVSLCPIDR